MNRPTPTPLPAPQHRQPLAAIRLWATWPLAGGLLALGLGSCGLQSTTLGPLSLKAPRSWVEERDVSGAVAQLSRDGGQSTVKLLARSKGPLRQAPELEVLAYVRAFEKLGYHSTGTELLPPEEDGRERGLVRLVLAPSQLGPRRCIGWGSNGVETVFLALAMDEGSHSAVVEADFKLLLAELTLDSGPFTSVDASSKPSPAPALPAPSSPSPTPSASESPAQYWPGMGPNVALGAPLPTPNATPGHTLPPSGSQRRPLLGGWLMGLGGFSRFTINLPFKATSLEVLATGQSPTFDVALAKSVEVLIYAGPAASTDAYAGYTFIANALAATRSSEGHQADIPLSGTPPRLYPVNLPAGEHTIVVNCHPDLVWGLRWKAFEQTTRGQEAEDVKTLSFRQTAPEGWPRLR